MITRRTFLSLAVAACAAGPALFVPVPENQLNHRLEQICFSLGRWSRGQNVQIQRVIMTDDHGHLVLDGKCSQDESDYSFHLADRSAKNYTKIVYSVEPRYLLRARELSAIVHVVGQDAPYRFPVMFA